MKDYKNNKTELLEEIEKEYTKILVRKSIKTILKKFFFIIIIILICFNLIFGVSIVEGNSMYPVISTKDIIFFNRLNKNIERDDIVVFSLKDKTLLLKRAIAIEGDEINIVDSKITVNGEEVADLNNEDTLDKDIFPIKLEKDQFFVIGDNNVDSVDSRHFGAINMKNIKGKLISIFRIKF